MDVPDIPAIPVDQGNPSIIRRHMKSFTVLFVVHLQIEFTQNHKELAQFLDAPRIRVLSIDDETAEFYASALNSLKKSGSPIPTNDLWIGAAALQHGLALYSKDQHFKWIPGLTCVD